MDFFTFLSGKPPPAVTWWKDSILLDDSYQAHNHVVRNELVIDSLDRSDLHSAYTCQASNNNISVPAVNAVTVDMNCKYIFSIYFTGVSK